MRKLKLFFACLLMTVLSIGQVWGADFVPSDFTDQGTSGTGSAISATVDGVTFACDKGYGTTQIRCYSGGKITISSSNTITAISFTFSGSYAGGLETSYSSLSTTSWEKTLSSQARITAITVTTSGGNGGQGGDDPEPGSGDDPEPGSGDDPEPGSGDGEVAGSGTINFGSAIGSTNVNATSVSGNDSRGKTWTITTVPGSSGESFSPNASYAQIGASSKPASSITFTTTLNEAMTVTAFSAKFGGFNGTAGTVTLKVGDTSVGTGSLNASTDVIVNASNTTTSGTVLTVTVTGISKGVKAYYISYTVAEGGSQQTGVIAKQGETTYNVNNPLNFSHEAATSQSLTLECSNMTATSSSAALYSDEACNTAVSQNAWVTNISATASAVTFDVAANDGDARDVYMKITATDETNTPTTIVKISQSAAPLTTMDAIYSAAENAGTTPTDVVITFNNWVVSGVSTNGKSVYLTDGTKGLIIFDNGGNMGFAAGNILSGTVTCKVQMYNGAAELTTLNSSTTGLTVTESGTVSLNETALADLSGINTGSLIKVTGTCTTNDNKYYINDVQLYNSLYAFSALSAETEYECTGVYVYYKKDENTAAVNEILPRSEEDIVAQVSVAKPMISVQAGTYTEVQNVTLSCTTANATIYYTTNGDNPDNTSTEYNNEEIITVDVNMTIKAIAYVGDEHSEIASAAYVINIPLPEHGFDVTHDFTQIDFTNWSSSYAEREVTYTDDKVIFASASKQSNTIADRPVTKGNDVSLILTNSAKVITAVKFECQQWTTKEQTITLKYSTDGGATFSALNPSVTSANFAVQSLSLPAGVDAVCISFSSQTNQVGISSVSFDLDDKPIVSKTVTINAPDAAQGTLVVKNGNEVIESPASIVVGTKLTIFATPEAGYSVSAVSVVDADNVEVAVDANNEFLVPNSDVTVSATFVEDERPVATLILNVQGTTSPFAGSYKVNDEITLPTTATNCEGNVFVGWSESQITTPGTKPETQYYEKGALYTLSAETQTLYAVYAKSTPVTWQITSDDLSVLDNSASSSYDKYKGDQTKDGITYNIADVMPATGGNAGTMQIKASAGTLYNKTAMPKDIISIEIEGVDMAVYEGTEIIYSQPESGAITKADDVYSFTSGNKYFFLKKTTSGAGYASSITVNMTPIYSDYTTMCIEPVDVPEPTFDVVTGTYTEEKLVAISNYDDDYIYVYTLDGTEPTLDADLDAVGTGVIYDNNDGIEISASCTLKCRAYDADGNYSDVTEATYTMNLPLTTMEAIFAKATEVGSTATEVTVEFNNWVVSGVATDGKTVYVTNGTNGFIIYNNTANEHGFAVNNILSGSVTCNIKQYNGAAELVGVKATTAGLTVSEGGSVSATVKTISDLSGIYTGALVTINTVKFDGTNLSDGTNSIKPYTSIFEYEAMTKDHYYNVTGIYLQYNNTKEILPRGNDDIVELEQTAPVMAWYTSSTKDVEIAGNSTYSISIGETFAPIFETNSHGTLTYSSSNTSVAEIDENGAVTLKNVAGTTLIKCAVGADDEQNLFGGELSFTLRVREAATIENVVILAKLNNQWYAMKNESGTTSNSLKAVAVTYTGGKISGVEEDDQASFVWKRSIDGDNVTFQDANNKYLTGEATKADITLGTTECNWNWYEEGGYYRVGTSARTFLATYSTQNSEYIFKNYATTNTNGYSSLPIIRLSDNIFVAASEPTVEPAEDGEVVVEDDQIMTITTVKSYSKTVRIKKRGIISLGEGGKIETTRDLIFSADSRWSSQMAGVIDGASANVTAANIYYEKDFVAQPLHWYNVAVPFKVELSDGIINKANNTALTRETNFNFYYYDGNTRATEGKNGSAWVEETTELQPGVNYLCVFDQPYGIIRFKKKADENLNNAAAVGVTAHSSALDATNSGWNGIANNGLTYAGFAMTGITYVQILNAAGDGYMPVVLSQAVFGVGTPFFVQVAESGSVVFNDELFGDNYYGAPQRTNDMNVSAVAIELKKNDQMVDRLYVTASEEAAPTYQVGKDVAKFISNSTAQLWVNNYNEKLCANDAPLVNNQAIYDLGLFTPAAGTYSLSAAAIDGADLYVTYEGQIIWNLSLGDYELDLARGTTTGYGLLLVVQPNQMPTGVENGELLNGENGVQKILLNGQLYILRDGHLYDAVGKEMK